MNSLELFAGCGGLAYGIAEAGFSHRLIVESDSNAFSTLELNKKSQVRHVATWPIINADVRNMDYSEFQTQNIHLVSGGPPCQPFSIGGSHKGPMDKRNMWPEAIRCIQEIEPTGFIFENVKGLLRPAFSPYLRYITLQLSFPRIVKDKKESLTKHLARLIACEKRGSQPFYNVTINDINTADYGAAQKRNRAIIVGLKSQLDDKFSFPVKTHSRESLIWEKYKTNEYWDIHKISTLKRSKISDNDKKILKKIELTGKPIEKAWVTVRDAIGDLPKPRPGIVEIANHELHPGARIYAGHTGSTLDEPAKALKAGAHGVPGGENVLVDSRGNIRYFTIREMARLQGLPDDYAFNGSWVSTIRQLGNAVPVQVGCFFGKEIMRRIPV